MDCRPVGDLGLTSGGIPDESITVSSSEVGYSKEVLKLVLVFSLQISHKVFLISGGEFYLNWILSIGLIGLLSVKLRLDGRGTFSSNSLLFLIQTLPVSLVLDDVPLPFVL